MLISILQDFRSTYVFLSENYLKAYLFIASFSKYFYIESRFSKALIIFIFFKNCTVKKYYFISMCYKLLINKRNFKLRFAVIMNMNTIFYFKIKMNCFKILFMCYENRSTCL
jgi:hypothetical protein